MKNKSALLSSLSLFVCFCLLTGLSRLIVRYIGNSVPLLLLAEVLSFALPALLVYYAAEDRDVVKKHLAWKTPPKGGLRFAVFLGITVAMFALASNIALGALSGQAGGDFSAATLPLTQSKFGTHGIYYVFAAAAALVEELYLRGVLMPIEEQDVGTSACILFAGITFALLQGEPLRMPGAFAAGCAFAYMAYILGSVWPAVIAHLAGGLYLAFSMWMTDTYAPFGIWNYFPACNLLGLLFFLYLTVRTAQGMLVRDSVPHFEKSAGWYDLWLLMRRPGVLVFIVAFAAKIVLDTIG